MASLYSNYIVSDAMEEYGLSVLGELVPGGAIPNVYLDAFKARRSEGIDKLPKITITTEG